MSRRLNLYESKTDTRHLSESIFLLIRSGLLALPAGSARIHITAMGCENESGGGYRPLHRQPMAQRRVEAARVVPRSDFLITACASFSK